MAKKRRKHRSARESQCYLLLLALDGRTDVWFIGRERSFVAPVAQECVPLVFIGRLHTAAVAAAPAAAAAARYGTSGNHK